MAIQLSTTVRNARVQAIETTVGTSAVLQIRSGSAPAACSSADSGTLLASITCPSDWLTAPSGGTGALSGTWSTTGSNAGTAGHFRLKDSSATTCHMQGSITAAGGGGDATIDNTSIAVGQTVNVQSFNLTDGNP